MKRDHSEEFVRLKVNDCASFSIQRGVTLGVQTRPVTPPGEPERGVHEEERTN